MSLFRYRRRMRISTWRRYPDETYVSQFRICWRGFGESSFPTLATCHCKEGSIIADSWADAESSLRWNAWNKTGIASWSATFGREKVRSI